jgi:hypothetical protein
MAHRIAKAISGENLHQVVNVAFRVDEVELPTFVMASIPDQPGSNPQFRLSSANSSKGNHLPSSSQLQEKIKNKQTLYAQLYDAYMKLRVARNNEDVAEYAKWFIFI